MTLAHLARQLVWSTREYTQAVGERKGEGRRKGGRSEEEREERGRERERVSRGTKRERKKREREREDRLHIKWTGNEPGYVESVGKSVCRCLSAKFARFFTWRTFRLHRVHARAHAQNAVYTTCRVRVYARVRIYGRAREQVEGRSLVKSAQGARNGRRFSTFAIAQPRMENGESRWRNIRLN